MRSGEQGSNLVGPPSGQGVLAGAFIAGGVCLSYSGH